MKLDVKNISFNYDSVRVLKNLTLNVEGGEILSIVGPNGSGKTTLLRCINRAIKPREGTVLLEGKNVAKMNFMEIAKKMSTVRQSADTAFPSTVLDMVLMGRRPYIKWSVTPKDLEIVDRVMKLVDINHLTDRYLDELSGGERQKVTMARALAQEPKVLLLDEPTANLDVKNQLEILSIIKDLVKRENMAVVIAIHDLNLAARFSDKMVMLKDGAIVAAGSPNSVLTQSNIMKVYGVEVKILENISDAPYIIPLTHSPQRVN